MDIEPFAHIVADDLEAPLNGSASMADVVVADFADRLDHKGTTVSISRRAAAQGLA